MTRRRSDRLTPLPAWSLPAWWLVACLLWVLAPTPAGAQFQQYTPPGSTADRPGDDRERLERQLEEALWRAGPLRLSPWIGITDAALVSNAFNAPETGQEDEDVTFTVGAGLRGIMPFGPKTFLTLEAIPQYVFWLEQEERNTFNEWYGARLHGFYNRLYVEAGGGRRDQVQRRSSEFDVETNTRRDSAQLTLELRLASAVHVFASGVYAEIRTLEEEADPRLPAFSDQDRDESAVRGGLRYKPRATSFIGAGIESTEADFARPDRDRSNRGDSPFVEIQHESPAFFLTAEVVFRDLEPEGEMSQFVPVDDTTGSLQLTFEPGWRMSYTPYARRDLSYALDQEYSHFLRDRWGLRIGVILTDRWNAGLYGEGGVDDFVALAAGAPRREDDFTSYGVDFGFRVSPRFDLAFGYSIDEWRSNLPGFDRQNDRIRLSIGTSGLTLGRR